MAPAGAGRRVADLRRGDAGASPASSRATSATSSVVRPRSAASCSRARRVGPIGRRSSSTSSSAPRRPSAPVGGRRLAPVRARRAIRAGGAVGGRRRRRRRASAVVGTGSVRRRSPREPVGAVAVGASVAGRRGAGAAGAGGSSGRALGRGGSAGAVGPEAVPPPGSCRRTSVPSLMTRAPRGRARARRLPAVPAARRRARSIGQFGATRRSVRTTPSTASRASSTSRGRAPRDCVDRASSSTGDVAVVEPSSMVRMTGTDVVDALLALAGAGDRAARGTRSARSTRRAEHVGAGRARRRRRRPSTRYSTA